MTHPSSSSRPSSLSDPSAPSASPGPEQRICDEFRRVMSPAGGAVRSPALVVRAPGRVNLIGEHTDYNDGFVLPMAIDRAVWIALAPRSDRRLVVRSLDLDQQYEVELDRLAHEGEGWIEYIKGVAWSLGLAGRPAPGWEGVIASEVPIGAGLSSSAALELAALRAFVALGHGPWEPPTMAALAQRAEREWVGVSCGIMDQLAAASGWHGHALLIDCRSLAIEHVPLPTDATVVVLDTDTRRGLVDSAYNERREQCERAARILGVPALRDATLADLEARSGALDPVTLRRARHVISENERTLAAARVLHAGDVPEMGRLMNQSHASLRDDFEVSGPELDVMVRHAQAHPACHGARLTGAGFAGCAVALVRTSGLDAFITAVSAGYRAETGRTPRVYPCTAADGASVVRVDELEENEEGTR
jgi:galactokinase